MVHTHAVIPQVGANGLDLIKTFSRGCVRLYGKADISMHGNRTYLNKYTTHSGHGTNLPQRLDEQVSACKCDSLVMQPITARLYMPVDDAIKT